MNLSLREILRTIEAKPVGYLPRARLKLNPEGISTDSRTIRRGELFFALLGENFDGTDFVDNAFKRGAIGAVVHKDKYRSSWRGRVILSVEDTLLALQKLAGYYRRKFDIPLVAITGSNGKTTTKDMTSEILKTKFNVLKTEGNFNNLIGLPLTLFRFSSRTQIAVVELGASAKGEIKKLSEIADPTVGLITNIGPAHLKFFGSLQNVLDSKAELLEYMNSYSTAVLNMDDPLLREVSKRTRGKILGYGFKTKTDLQGEILSFDERGCGRISVEGTEVQLKVPGKHNLYNALGAIAIGKLFGIDLQQMVKSLENFASPSLRCEFLCRAGIKVINDTYNANPDSMKSALDLLASLNPGGSERRIALLGDMLELGESSERIHRDIGEYTAKLGIDCIFALGEFSKSVLEGAANKGDNPELRCFKDNKEAGDFLCSYLKKGDLLLVKGSRALKMEEIIQILSKVKEEKC